MRRLWSFGDEVRSQYLALLLPTSKRACNVQYQAISWLNDDILLGIFDCYRLDEKSGWNDLFGWRKLSHVCQRWRHLVYECAFHLGAHIKCTNSSPIVEMLDHFPPLPLFIDYGHTRNGVTLTEQDEVKIYHTLRLHDRVSHIDLNVPSSVLHKVSELLDTRFPMLESLSLTFSATYEDSLPFTLPKAFRAQNLRHLSLPSISPPRRLQLLTSTVSLITLELSNIQASSYSRPRLLVARLRSLPQLKELSIRFSTPIPRPSTERELLGEQGTLVTLPSLEILEFEGDGAYLESLVAQMRVPLLNQLKITLFDQIALVLPHLFHLINVTDAFRLRSGAVGFDCNGVFLTTDHHGPPWTGFIPAPFLFRVMCEQLDQQRNYAFQICNALIPLLRCVEHFSFEYSCKVQFNEWGPLVIVPHDDQTWHGLLRSLKGANHLYIPEGLLHQLSRVLRMEQVGSDPGFLRNLRSIHAPDNWFTEFIDTRQVAGRPVLFVRW